LSLRVAGCLAALLGLAPGPAAGQAATAAGFVPSVEQEPLGGALTLLRMKDDAAGHVNAILSAGPDGLLLVDHAADWRTMTCDSAAAAVFERAIRAHGDGRLRYLVNTHWHGDHVGGNERYGREAVIIAHRATRDMLRAPQKPWWHPDGLRALERHGWPALVFDNSMSLFVNGEEVQFWHFGEAHSEGDAVVYFSGAKVAHLGDLYHGFETLSMPTDAEGMQLALAGIAARLPADARIVTGHAGVTGVEELRRYARMYGEVLAHVRARLAKGERLEAIREGGLPEPWKSEWKGGPAQVPMWIDSMARGLGVTPGG
jgi:glyoxylase-like metal-dependent hydrolase (beta-lactamase superfamily II)